jgi:hypothetical protein
MTNNPQFADAVVIDMLEALDVLLNSGGKFEIFSGSQPADANTAITSQVLLATCTFSSTAFGTPVASGSAGSRTVIATANALTSGIAVATGTAAWYRAYEADGATVVMDGTVGVSGCDLNIGTTSIVAGATVAINTLTLSEAE